MTRTRSWLRPAIALATVLLLGAACANDDGSDSAAGTGSTGAATTGGGTTASTGSTDNGGGGRYDYGSGGGGGNDDSGMDDSGGEDGDHAGHVALTADNFAFAPTAIEAKAGSEISIENANAATPHTFTIDGTAIDLELSPGDVEDVTIDLDPGAYDFHCRFHASMTGTLTVT